MLAHASLLVRAGHNEVGLSQLNALVQRVAEGIQNEETGAFSDWRDALEQCLVAPEFESLRATPTGAGSGPAARDTFETARALLLRIDEG
jgi:hypothetical protein